ncbi:MAG: YciI family protein [Candidatus Hermodarchaeota archaeon]
MIDKQNFYAIIKPYRQDFITNPKEEEEKIMSDHFEYLKSLLKQKKLFLAGPTLIPEEPFGLIILETETEEEAKELIKADPSVKAGIQKIADFRPIRLSLTRK